MPTRSTNLHLHNSLPELPRLVKSYPNTPAVDSNESTPMASPEFSPNNAILSSSFHGRYNDDELFNIEEGMENHDVLINGLNGRLDDRLGDIERAGVINEGGLKPPRRNSSRSINKVIKKVGKWITKQPTMEDDYKIEYSILCKSNESLSEDEFNDLYYSIIPYKQYHYTLNQFNKLINQILKNIDITPPLRISKGSSGSYFIYTTNDNTVHHLSNRYITNNNNTSNPFNDPIIIGVFKPKSEEPYGPLSPKWQKWIHRTFFPWFFGRSCLLKNQGYISESLASYIDQRLLSFIVPYTDIIYLKSDSFFYGFWSTKILRKPSTWKIGSFQIFLNNYIDANQWFKNFPLPELSTLPDDWLCEDKVFKWSKRNLLQFQEELEKLIILDYLIRNTDRGLDNWMINVEWVLQPHNDKFGGELNNEITAPPHKKPTKPLYRPVLKIGAIDSGLAFPWKHPNEWRSFPYGWLFLPFPLIGRPFSPLTRQHYLKLLTSKSWWENTIMGLKKISFKDSKFNEKYFKRQISVIKGQAFNIISILSKDGKTPLDLTNCKPIVICDDIIDIPDSSPSDNSPREDLRDTTSLLKTKKAIIERMEQVEGRAFFTWC